MNLLGKLISKNYSNNDTHEPSKGLSKINN